ncbi:MAG: aryl-sulfate sulfotransferase [Proteobacteria bacterium]|nr:aryl-sulfate sulfotransferase [Pseudomonadota bacterium]
MKFTTEPHIEKHPNDAVPLVAMVYFKADGKAATTLEIDNGKKKRSVTFDETHDPEQGLPVIGMRANSEHWVTVKTGDADAVKLTYCTPPLPENPREMPNIELVTSKADEMAPGWTILSIRRRPITRAIWMTQKQFEFQNRWSLLVILDEEGEVVWYYRADSRIAGVHRLQNGNLFYHHVNFRSIEMDLCGNVVKRFHATNRPFGPVENSIGIEAQSLHHQPHEMPNGNYLALTANAREIENYYTSETDPDAPRATQKVVGDNIVEFTPDGEIIWSWNTFDHLDVMRICYHLFVAYWHTRGFPKHLDWSHGNGVTYDEHDDSIMVSLRHQDAIIKIDKKTKEIVWILGDHTGWKSPQKEKLLTPTHDLRWHYHGHNPRVTGPNRFVMYDNGICRAMPFHDPEKEPAECFARAVEYEVDPENMTVTEVWVSSTDESDDRVISMAMGDAHQLPNDNMFVIDSLCLTQEEELNRLGTVKVTDLTWNEWNRSEWHIADFPSWGRIREMKRTGDRDVVFEAHVSDTNDMLGWEVFGGARISGLYPAGIEEAT